jgi:hypothetical protein
MDASDAIAKDGACEERHAMRSDRTLGEANPAERSKSQHGQVFIRKWIFAPEPQTSDDDAGCGCGPVD